MCMRVCVWMRDRGSVCTKAHTSSTHRLLASSGRGTFCASLCPLAGRMPEGTGEQAVKVRERTFPISLRPETHSDLTWALCKLPGLAGH